MNEREILARYRRMLAWVGRERRRLRGRRPSQTYLRRARLCTEIDALTLRELLRELRPRLSARRRARAG